MGGTIEFDLEPRNKDQGKMQPEATDFNFWSRQSLIRTQQIHRIEDIDKLEAVDETIELSDDLDRDERNTAQLVQS